MAETGAGGGARLERILGVGAIALLSGSLALSEYGRFAQRDRLVAEVEAARADADAALSAVIPAATLEEAEKSVYVIYTERGTGSAFVVDRERGVLATAAHVAADLEPGDDKDPPLLYNRFTRKPIRVYAKRLHAGYLAVTRVAEDVQPIDPESRILNPDPIGVHDLANDAALLFVDPVDPETGAFVLGPSLPIASLEKLIALKPGDPVASISYPSNVIDSEIIRKSGAARSERGTISNLISAIDVGSKDGKPGERRLIVHRMTTAPGSSGAPLFNGAGEIVGVGTHGIPDGDKVAQRADVLHDLLTALREETVLAKTYEPEWRARLEAFIPAKKALPLTAYRIATRNRLSEEEAEQRFSAFDLAAKPPFDAQTIDATYQALTREFILPADDLTGPRGAGAPGQGAEEDVEGGAAREGLPAAPVSAFRIRSSGQYSQFRIRLEPDRRYAIYAFDYNVANTIRNSGYCIVRIYDRLLGAGALRATPASGLPLIQYEPAAKMRQAEIVFARPYDNICAATTDAFTVGIVSWEEKPPGAATPTAEVSRVAFVRAQIGGAFDKISNFADCRLVFGDRNQCAAPIRAEYFVPDAHEPPERR
jgi:S1-C subfamily serine protease